jgi:hypothetical protein
MRLVRKSWSKDQGAAGTASRAAARTGTLPFTVVPAPGEDRTISSPLRPLSHLVDGGSPNQRRPGPCLHLHQGYRLDFFRPYLWMLATARRRAVFSLAGIALAGWMLWAYWPN